MNKTEKQIAAAAGRFARRWEGKRCEKGESQLFWTELLKAHRYNDRAVMAAYGVYTTIQESEIVSRFSTLNTQLVEHKK